MTETEKLEKAEQQEKKPSGRERGFVSRRERISRIRDHGTKEERDLLDCSFMVNSLTISLIERVKKGNWEEAGYSDQHILFSLRGAIKDMESKVKEYAG